MWQDCVEWYEDACLTFEEDTPNGDLVRATIEHEAAPAEEEHDEPKPAEKWCNDSVA